ncbi:caspase family protein [Microcoleus sp. Pol17_C1]|uniref:caspase family protein n=1 Tax=unclassified Microcoleus TaxID=2642155 RepID=UPI002FD0C8BF
MTNRSITKNKWALLIGINKYPNYPQNKQLFGCLNDVELMKEILQTKFSFPEIQISQLLDEQATRDGILTALETLVNQVSHNDIVVIHYSGHGSSITDREGDKPDGMDETIVPYDSGRAPHKNRDITDDELYAWLLQLSEKTPYITLIFDSCHSGGIVRDTFGAAVRSVEPDTRSIKDLPPSPIAANQVRGTTREIGASGWLPMSQRYVLIAGCNAKESSYEYLERQQNTSVTHGALTYFLCKELRFAQSGMTYRDVFERASTAVTVYEARQHPQMEGARDRELFNIQEIQPMRFVSVKQRKNNQVTLAAGAALGLTVGSQWAIYPSGIHHIAHKTPKLGQVKITSVRALTSDAKIIKESQTNRIIPGSRAVEEAHFYGEMRLKVEFKAETDYQEAVNEMVDLISQSPLLRQTQNGEVADARIYIIAPRQKVTPDDPVPQLQMIEQPIWAVVGQDGQLLMPTRALTEAEATVILRENLEKIARYRFALALKNPNPESCLKDKIEFILKRKTSDGNWREAKPEDDRGQIVFREGDILKFEIVNHYQHPVFISILDFGLTYGVNPLYPVTGANQQFEPSKRVDIGLRQGEQIQLYLPDNFPFVSFYEQDSIAGGTEIFKVFATTYPTDFGALVQGGVRTGDSLLEDLLATALTGKGDRDGRPVTVPPDEDWTTVERSFFLQRKS